MPIWLIRGGPQGQYEQKFIQDKRIYVTWPDLNMDLSAVRLGTLEPLSRARQ
jgi:restriction system protein